MKLKNSVFVLSFLLLPLLAHGSDAERALLFPTCELMSISVHKNQVTQIATHDKFKHCDLSCRITLDCGWLGAWLVGNLKEFVDVFGPGEADVKDLVADSQGIKVGRSKNTKTYGDCDLGCDRYYSRH